MTDVKKQVKRKKSFPHTRAIQRDRQKRPSVAPADETIEQWLEEIIHPATLNQIAYFRQLGLRERILSLPVMVTFMISLLWRQLGSVREAVRVLREQGMLWVEPVAGVSFQAVLERMNTLSADLFYRVMCEIWPQMQDNAQKRSRPLPPAVAYAQVYFNHIWSVDGSVLDNILKKCGLLEEKVAPVLGGKITTIMDIVTQVPAHIWYKEEAQAHDQTFWEQILAVLPAGTLLLFDKGLIDYGIFDRLSQMSVFFITRLKRNASYQVVTTLSQTATIHDLIVCLGSKQTRCHYEMRLVKVLFRGTWYCYLTNMTDPQKLPPECVVALYDQRWRVEDAFNVVKRLLGLAYFYCGSLNAIQIQVWMTWLLYAMLVDLTDQVADALGKPFKAISIELVFRGLSHFTHVRLRGDADDPIEYLVRRAKSLSLVKQKRRNEHLSLVEQMNLTIPFPA
ncbi:MAG: IS4 family transposase [Acidimicrobiia bacterium]